MAVCELTFKIDTQRQSILLAQNIAMALRQGDLVVMEGDLGAGKTFLCRAILRSIAGDDRLEVPSPTYTIVQEYTDLVLPIAHFDLYRLGDGAELEELGLDAFLEHGAALIEWPQIAEDYLPEIALKICLKNQSDETRIAEFSCSDEFVQRFERSMLIREFVGDLDRSAFCADASARAYELVGAQADKAILMNAPNMPDGPPIKDGLPYSQLVHLAEDVGAFVAISNLLRVNDFKAPEIFKQNLNAGLLLTEDLGSGSILDEAGQPIDERYIAAAELLADIHATTWPNSTLVAEGTDHQIPRYDVRAMEMGLSLLPDWWGKENELSPSAAQELFELWRPHFERFQNGYDDLILRDYHSPNIIWCEGNTPRQQVGLIDFQDALIGPGAYDIASLMRDARVTISEDLQAQIWEAYVARAAKNIEGFNEPNAALDVATLAAFRSSRLLGLWVRLDLRDGKAKYRQHETRTKKYLKQSLAHPELSDLEQWYKRNSVI